MAEFVERGLNFVAKGEDQLTPVIDRVISSLDRLDRQAQRDFESIARQSQLASDAIKRAVDPIVPYWQDQLQSIAAFAGVAFAEVQDASMRAADSGTSAAAGLAAAWGVPMDQIAADAKGMASAVDVSFSSMKRSAATSSSGVKLDAESMGTSFKEIQDDAMLAASGTATGMGDVKKAVAAAVGPVKGDMDAVSKAILGPKGAFTDLATGAAGAAADIKRAVNGTVSPVKGDMDALVRAVAVPNGAFADLAASAGTAKSDIVKSMEGAVKGVDANTPGIKTALDGVQTQFKNTGASAGKAATEVGAAAKLIRDEVAGISLGAAGGKGAGKGVKASGAVAAEAGWLGGLLTVPPMSKFEEFGKKFHERLTTVMEKGISLGIGASIGGLFLNQAMTFVEGQAGAQAQTGLNPVDTFALDRAARGVGVTNVFDMLTRLNTKVLKGDLAGAGQLPAAGTEQASQINLGLGRYGTDVNTLTHTTGASGKAIVDKILHSIGLDGTALLAMKNPMEELKTIAEHLNNVANPNVRQADAAILFGARGGGPELALMIKELPESIAKSQKDYNPMKEMFPADALKSIMGAKQAEYTLQAELSLAVFKLTPVLGELSKAVGDLVKLVSGQGAAGAATDLLKNPVVEGYIGLKFGPKILKSVLGTFGGGAEAAAGAGAAQGALAKLGVGGAEKAAAGSLGMTVPGMNVAIAALLAAKGISDMIANPAAAKEAAKTMAGQGGVSGDAPITKWLDDHIGSFFKGIVGGGGSSKKGLSGHAADVARYVTMNAGKYGLDAAAVLATGYAETGLTGAAGDYTGKPGDKNRRPTSFGPWQLHEHGQLPARFNGNVKAADAWANSPAGLDYAMSHMGVAKGMTGTAAVNALITGFEKPKDGGAGDMKRASAVLSEFTKDVAKMQADIHKTWVKLDSTTKGDIVKIETALKAFGPNAAKALSSHDKLMLSTAEQFIGGIREGFDIATPTVTRWLHNFATGTLDTLKHTLGIKSPSTETEKIAKEYMAGIYQGLTHGGQQNQILGAITNIANGMIAQLKKDLKIKSPSEETARIGDYLAQGLGVGITRGTPAAALAARASTAGVLGGFAAGGGSFTLPGGGAGGVTNHIYVNNNITKSEQELARRIGDEISRHSWGRVKLQGQIGP